MIFDKLAESFSSHPFYQMASWLTDPFTFLEETRKKRGNSFRVNIGDDLKPIFVLSEPQDISKIFDSQYFDAPGTNSQIIEPILGTTSILSLSGQEHQSFRKIYSKAISEKLKDKIQIFNLIHKHYLSCLSRYHVGDSISITPLMRNLTLRIILEIVFDIDVSLNDSTHLESRNTYIQNLFNNLVEEAISPITLIHLYFPFLQQDLGTLSPWGKFLKTIQEVDSFIYDAIDAYNPSECSRSLIGLMIEYANTENLNRFDIRNNLLTFLLAGHDTTSVVLSWFFAWNSANLSINRSLTSEFQSYKVNDLPNVIYENSYLDSLVNETLRLYPVSMILFPRVAKKDIHLSNILIPAGSVVMVSPYLVHTNKKIYASPYTFEPTRFLNKPISQYEFLPFGGGSRYCLGSTFATTIIKSIIVLSSQSLGLEPLGSYKISPIRQGVMTAPNIHNYQVTSLNLL